jgi:rhomboid protease GluP
LLVPNEPAVGASGAIFAIFGAFGAFVLLRRRSLGPSANGIIGQWLFFLVINLIFSFTAANIGAYDHVGGLIVGFLMGALFVSISPRGRSAL